MRQLLRKNLHETGQRFIVKLIDRESNDANYRQSDAESQDVRIFLLLAFAAFEEYVESLAKSALEEVCSKWERERVLLRPLANMLVFYRMKHGITKDSTSRHESSAPIAACVEACKSRHSQVIWNSHGISMENIFQLFAPLGISMTKDPKFTGAANSLTKLRGEAAHRVSRTKEVSAKQVFEYAKDFEEYCAHLSDTLQQQMHK